MPRITMSLLAGSLFGLSLVTVAPARISAQSHALAEGHFVGTWKLNLAKSHFSGPAPKERSMVVADHGGGLYYETMTGVEADGRPNVIHYVARLDRKAYPMAQLGAEKVRTVTTWLKEPYVTAFELRQAGGTVDTFGTRKMSKDGSTLVVEMTDPKGKLVTRLWWERAK